MTKYNLTIIIVTFNSERYIKKCIDSIVSSNRTDLRIKVIIVDNYSKDKTIKVIKELKKKHNFINIFINKKNYGFAKAVNQGILKSTKRDNILLLNPDTILKKRSLISLIKCSIVNCSGISGGTTINIGGDTTGSFFRFPNLMVGLFDMTNLRKLSLNDRWHKYFYYLEDNSRKKSSFPVDVVTGGYMLIDRDTINRIGMFDESFFMYLEDVDYCYRAKKSGVRIVHCNTSKIIHFGGASSNNKDRVRHSSWLMSRKIYFIKHFKLLENIIIQPIFLLDDMFVLIMKTIKS